MSTFQQIGGRGQRSNHAVSPTTDNPAVPNAALARKQAIRLLAVGLVFLIVGLAITVITYSHASSSPTGGTYVVAWGPMLGGLVTTLRGLRALRQANRLY